MIRRWLVLTPSRTCDRYLFRWHALVAVTVCNALAGSDAGRWELLGRLSNAYGRPTWLTP